MKNKVAESVWFASVGLELKNKLILYDVHFIKVTNNPNISCRDVI